LSTDNGDAVVNKGAFRHMLVAFAFDNSLRLAWSQCSYGVSLCHCTTRLYFT